VIRSRANILTDNIVKWGCSNVIVTNNDPRDFQRLENYFDVIVVDAPCSGSGLFRRDPEAIEEWSEQNVALCGQRQQRILADVLPALKNGGVLIYSTCSTLRKKMRRFGSGYYECEILNLNFKLKTMALFKVKRLSFLARYVQGFFSSCFRKLYK
jgi:16S rRNA C967 or C1407 C5-methylase (RsmB/RsmF family)